MPKFAHGTKATESQAVIDTFIFLNIWRVLIGAFYSELALEAVPVNTKTPISITALTKRILTLVEVTCTLAYGQGP